MRKIASFIILIILLLPTALRAQGDFDTGVRLYIEASEALTERRYIEAVDMFTRAAPYLDERGQANALKMADFVNRMNPVVTHPRLINDSKVRLVGEVKDGVKIWHLYTSKNNFNILHLAVSGQFDLESIAAKLGNGSFLNEKVIRDTVGYISESTAYLPGAESRIRMWYCPIDDKTNIVYESYQTEYQAALMSDIFTGIYCGSTGDSLAILYVSLCLIVILGVAGYYYYKKRKEELE